MSKEKLANPESLILDAEALWKRQCKSMNPPKLGMTDEEIIMQTNSTDAASDVAMYLEDVVLKRALTTEERKTIGIQLGFWMGRAALKGKLELLESVKIAKADL